MKEEVYFQKKHIIRALQTKEVNVSDDFQLRLWNQLEAKLNAGVTLVEHETTLEGFPTVQYLTVGSGKESVLFLHGFGAFATSYEKLLKHLGEKFTVIAPMLPGYGTSLEDWFMKGGQTHALNNYVQFLERFISKIEIERPLTIVGHSLGGGIGIHYTNLFPAHVKKLVLIDSTGVPVEGTLLQHLYRNTLLIIDFVIKLQMIPWKWLIRLLKHSRTALFSYKVAFNINLEAELKNIKVDTIVYWGEENTLLPLKMAKKFKKCLKHVTVKIIKDRNYSWIYDSPENINIS